MPSHADQERSIASCTLYISEWHTRFPVWPRRQNRPLVPETTTNYIPPNFHFPVLQKNSQSFSLSLSPLTHRSSSSYSTSSGRHANNRSSTLKIPLLQRIPTKKPSQVYNSVRSFFSSVFTSPLSLSCPLIISFWLHVIVYVFPSSLCPHGDDISRPLV